MLASQHAAFTQSRSLGAASQNQQASPKLPSLLTFGQAVFILHKISPTMTQT